MSRTVWPRHAGRVLLAFCTTTLAACTSFSSVRNANVAPGPSLFAQANVSTPPGEQATWFFTMCETTDCNHPIAGWDANLSFGRVGDRSHPFALGVGINGFYPYVEGYLQIRAAPSAAGVGVRVGIPLIDHWSQHQLFMRFNKPVSEGRTFLWNPGLVLHTGRSPNGENPGTFLGFASGFGYEFDQKGVAFTPSATIVVSHAHHQTFSQRQGPELSMFAAGGLSLTFRNRAR